MEIALISLLGAVAVAGFLYFFRLAVRLPAPAVRRPDFGMADAFLAFILATLIVWLTIQIFGKKQVITPEIVIGSIVQYLGIVILIVGFMIFRDRNPILLFGLKWQGWPKGVLFALGSLLAAYPVIIFAASVPHLFGAKSESQDIVQYLQTVTGFQHRVLLILMAAVVAPMAEETIFRGYLHGVLRKYAGRWPSILVVSLIFAAMHGHLPALVPLFILAVALSVVYECTGSLWAPMLMHATFNSITVVAAFLWPDLLN